ncbi:ATP-binding protein, partial [mine drainage metagenome]
SSIESSYQWARVLRVADAVGRPVYAPLWRRPPDRVVREEIAAGLDIRFVHLAAEALDPAWLGERLDAERLRRLEDGPVRRAGVHVAGEGGEYETLVLNAPFFRQRIVLDDVERLLRPPTARLTIRKAHLAPAGPRPERRP